MITSLFAFALASFQQAPIMDSTRLSLIPVRMQEFVSQERVAGVVTLVMQEGRTLRFDAVGYSDLAKKISLKKDSIFQIMSMTKPITAIAIMILVDEGKVNLNDPIDRYLPQFSRMKVQVESGGTVSLVEARRKILVRHLLTHMSGISGSDPAPLTDEMKRHLTLEQLVDRIAKAPLSSDPGSRVSYSGVGTSVAGRIVEIASGMKFQDFLQARLFDPLDMKDTTFFLPLAKRPRLATVYFREGNKLHVSSDDPYRKEALLANPAGGLYSTASDFANVLQMMLNRGTFQAKRILSSRSVETMTQVQSLLPAADSSDSTTYGFGWAVARGPSNGANLMAPGAYGHSGAYGTYCWVDPKSRVCGLFLSQVVGGDSVVLDTFRTLVNASIGN